jgi:hypothetical protein
MVTVGPNVKKSKQAQFGSGSKTNLWFHRSVPCRRLVNLQYSLWNHRPVGRRVASALKIQPVEPQVRLLTSVQSEIAVNAPMDKCALWIHRLD